MGLITFVIGVPVLYVVDLLEIEKFQFPPPNNTILLVFSLMVYFLSFRIILLCYVVDFSIGGIFNFNFSDSYHNFH